MRYKLRRGYIPLFFILLSIFNNTIYAQVIRLTWNPNIEPDIKYYLIYRDTMSNPINEISRVYKPDTTYFDDDIIIGKGYYYRIAAVDSADNIGEFSDDIYVYADNFTRVNLISFTVEVIDDKIVLRWKITPKNDNFSFEIQRSDDSENFNQIGFVSGCRTSPDLATYSFIDPDLSHVKSYYRIKRIGADGNFEYSNVIKVELSLPEKFKLSQNYPNPFNPETTIKYSMAKEGKVSLIIFDILGKEIRKLVDEHKKAGYYEVKWDGKDNYGINASSGIYFCRMRGNGYNETKKILLSR